GGWTLQKCINIRKKCFPADFYAFIYRRTTLYHIMKNKDSFGICMLIINFLVKVGSFMTSLELIMIIVVVSLAVYLLFRLFRFLSKCRSEWLARNPTFNKNLKRIAVWSVFVAPVVVMGYYSFQD